MERSDFEPVVNLPGRYEILGLIGSGGMESVYRAKDVLFEQLIAQIRIFNRKNSLEERSDE